MPNYNTKVDYLISLDNIIDKMQYLDRQFDIRCGLDTSSEYHDGHLSLHLTLDCEEDYLETYTLTAPTVSGLVSALDKWISENLKLIHKSDVGADLGSPQPTLQLPPTLSEKGYKVTDPNNIKIPNSSN